MKWFFLTILTAFILLVLLLTFGGDLRNTSASPAPTVQPTIGPLPTVDTRVQNIYYNLNMAIEDMERSTKFTMLEHINGASYQVVNVGFLPRNDGSQIFQIDVRCECAGNASCCSTLHTFVILMEAMDNEIYQGLIVGDVPPTVTEMEVQCFDHTGFSGKMIMPWQNVVSFLQDNLDGFRLWSGVTPSANP